MDINKRFSEHAKKTLLKAISEAHGNEVFAGGFLSEEGLVNNITVFARGTENDVIVHPESYKSNVFIHNHPSGVLYPSLADQNVASICAQNTRGFFIINNEVTEVYVVVEPIRLKKKVSLDLLKTASYISNDGPLSKQNEYFEERKSQIELLKSVCEVFNDNKIGVFEAGTGVGKSYAYIIPALLWTIENNERVVISTGTINLQHQLYEKDIPTALKVINKQVKVVLVKGRQNFVCLRRLNDALGEKDLFSDENDELETIHKWTKTTQTGSRSDLSFMPKESIWQRINSESDACLGMRCPFHEDCFVMQMRKQASEANILIVNHHMLFADIEMRMTVGYDDTAVLPSYTRIILDEAHGIENAATSFFSERISRFKLLKQMNLIYRKRKGAIAGYFYVLETLSSENASIQELVTITQEFKHHIEDMEESALQILGDNYSWRLSDKTVVSAENLLYLLDVLYKDIATYTSFIRKIIKGIPEDEQQNEIVWETKMILSRLDSTGVLCHNFCEWEEQRETVFWIEKRVIYDKVYPQLIQTPLNIAPFMNKGVYEPFKTVVCTSATLQIAGNFNYWMTRNGAYLADFDRIITGEYKSPFPYDSNLLLSIPTDAPFSNSVDFQFYVEDMIKKLCEAIGGATLVLFTSYESLRSAWNATSLPLAKKGIKVYKQGDDDRFRLLELFKKEKNSVLFATDSFWEGVDVPGESLSQVIIVKLPFSVPSDPIYAARAENIEKQDRSAFMELSLPSAVIKFRQGFGRLLRRTTDYGSVVVLDKRLITKQYGKLFLGSIPNTKKCFKSSNDILKTVKNFFDK
ncbi:MAG: helicase [Treponema sp. CETP13]|nr:MAG: helicase [Treponema sp. CETP13]